MKQLECFQGELAKRALRWPAHLSNTAAVVTQGLPSIRCEVLVRKFGLLLKLLDVGAVGVGASVFHCLLNDVSSTCVIRECRDLEEYFGTGVTDSILCQSETSIRGIKNRLRKIDKEITLKRCEEKAPLVADVEKRVSWTKLWDAALDLGVKHTRGLQALARVMSHHGRGVRPCPMCDVPGHIACLLNHVLEEHCEPLELGRDLRTRESLLSLVVD